MIKIEERLGDTLEITKKRDKVIIDAFIDNTGRAFKIDKKELINYLLGIKNE